jgi:hypothetical protein
MLPQVQNNVFVYKFLSGLSTVGFSKYTIAYLSFSPKESVSCFGSYENGIMREKLEGKIITKAWKELPTKFPVCILGDYSLSPDSFSGIMMIDNSQALENPKKYIPKIISEFKSRSTKLLNHFHGTHGRVFWKNSYDSIDINNVETFNKALMLLKSENPRVN